MNAQVGVRAVVVGGILVPPLTKGRLGGVTSDDKGL